MTERSGVYDNWTRKTDKVQFQNGGCKGAPDVIHEAGTGDKEPMLPRWA